MAFDMHIMLELDYCTSKLSRGNFKVLLPCSAKHKAYQA